MLWTTPSSALTSQTPSSRYPGDSPFKGENLGLCCGEWDRAVKMRENLDRWDRCADLADLLARYIMFYKL
jgi:hypothetical protein